MELRDRLELYQDMVQCCHNLYLWVYDRELTLIRSNCPHELTVRNLFSIGGGRDLLLSFASEHSKPILMTNQLGMMWAAIPEKTDDELRHIFMLGPFFLDALSSQDIEDGLKKLSLSLELRQDVLRFLHSLPVISLNRIFEYVIMLYFCITGQRITVSDLHYQEREPMLRPDRQHTKSDVHGTYEMEQEMVRMVREGDLSIQTHMNRLAVSGSMGTLASGDSTRQMKNAVLVCIVLFSRAAIEGGLSPEVAMTLTDRYFQSVEASRSLPELTEIATTMQNDFVERVHKIRTRRFSKPVLECCDYINLHLEEKLTLKELAERFRYSEYYLSRKFSQELGMSFKDYIRHQRLERAKAMLRDSGLGIGDISDQLHFCSPSYFSEQFKAEYGISPTQWRDG